MQSTPYKPTAGLTGLGVILLVAAGFAAIAVAPYIAVIVHAAHTIGGAH